MEFELKVETTDPTFAVTLQGSGPSFSITTLGISRVAMCIAYRDSVTQKYYDCAPFFIEIQEKDDADFCDTNVSSCYCTSTCVSDFSTFC